MESNYSFGGHRERRDDRILLAALLIAYETISEPGMTEERKRQIARGVLCEFCRLNMPLENGHHVILGVEVPCDAERTPEDDLNTDDLPFAALAAATNDYPADLLQARRAWWQKQIRECNNPLEQRLAAIDAALGSGLDMETVNNLLEEKAEILITLGKE
jgi:hypothetical protein